MALVYKVTAGPAGAADVVSRLLTVTADGKVVSEKSHPADATSFDEVSVEEDASVVVTLVDVDNAGNQSKPAFIEFVAKDTIAPPAPGELGVTLVREDA